VATIPRSTFLTCYFDALTSPPPGPCDLSLPHWPAVSIPRPAASQLETRCLTPAPALPASPRTSTPLRGFSSPPARSVPPDSVPGKPAFQIRPISPRSPPPILFWFRLRINVPGPLRFRLRAYRQPDKSTQRLGTLSCLQQIFLFASTSTLL
jgi:hypothetical protein